MPLFKAKEFDYYYSKKGTGSPIIFAHGLFVDHSMFDKQIDILKKTYTCYSFDLPGHGKSGYNKAGWSLDDMVEDFRTFIIDNHLRNVTLIGLSQGGMIFMRLAARYPELVHKLILVGTSPLAENQNKIPIWKESLRIFKEGTDAEFKKRITDIQSTIINDEFQSKYPDEFKNELSIMTSNQPQAMILATKAAVINRTDVRKELPFIVCPTLILCGDEDKATPVDVSLEMKTLIRDSQLITIPHAAHHLPIEVPEEFYQAIVEFLKPK